MSPADSPLVPQSITLAQMILERWSKSNVAFSAYLCLSRDDHLESQASVRFVQRTHGKARNLWKRDHPSEKS